MRHSNKSKQWNFKANTSVETVKNKCALRPKREQMSWDVQTKRALRFKNNKSGKKIKKTKTGVETAKVAN